ncbi:sensor histidine kinase YycG [Ruminiclostridium hungatei]|uniref:histidine kinase n=1 Tax=Ruminiclostridium hungatei TaxID=48256 RepID=A0A1V4SHW6_RUMHU|nr:HAMP domain-containing sensor histidine kinase [Ruminiclostridium hungatei]OPX43353.1 sensor histidine kinase YycG [Ruminiclostridium hungatei]
MKFSTRMVLYYSMTSVVVLLIVGAVVIKSIETYWINKVDQQLAAQDTMVQDYINQVFLFEKNSTKELNEQNAKMVSANLSSGVGQLLIYDRDLRLLSGLVDIFEHPDFRMDAFQKEVLLPAQKGDTVNYIQNNIYYYASPAKIDGRNSGIIVISYKLDLLNLILNKAIVILCMGAAIFCLVILILSILISRRLSVPIKRLVITTGKYAKRDFELVEISRNDELGQLGRSINDMGMQLKDHIDRQKQFVSNVSHELCTPLAAIKGYTEYLADEVMGDPGLDKVIFHLDNETSRLTNLVNDLLQMSRMDSFNEKFSFQKLNLSDLLTETAEKMRDRASGHKIDLCCGIDRNIHIEADRDKLVQVLVNLLDNAIKYSREKTSVEVRLASDSEYAVITVADGGIGIPEEDLDKVFDRFYRSQNASGIPGTGLGLSICKEIIERHKGEIYICRTETGGTEVRVLLPL